MSRFEELKQLLSGGVSESFCLFCCDENDRNIIVGGTREQSFKVNFTSDIIQDILITYKQDDKVIIRKTLKDVKLFENDSNTIIYYQLNEEDTIKFNPKYNAYLQLKVILKENQIIESKIFELNIINELTKEELTRKLQMYCKALDVFIVGQMIHVNENYPLISGSANIYKCHFEFDASWDNYPHKKVVFKDQYHKEIEKIDLNETNECFIPNEVLEKPGIINISVIGNEILFGSELGNVRPTLWSNSIRVYSGGK